MIVNDKKICMAYSLIDTFPLEPTIKIIPLTKLKTNLISNFFITKNYHRKKIIQELFIGLKLF